MSIVIRPRLEAELRARAQAEGVSLESYLERLLELQKDALGEIESLAKEGLHSGEPLQPGAGYWEKKHQQLDDSFKRTS